MPADRATLAALARRLEEGERKHGVFWDAARALLGDPDWSDEWWNDLELFLQVHSFLEAAAALVERVLPEADGWEWHLTSNGAAHLINHENFIVETASFIKGQPAAALVLTMLRVMMAPPGGAE